MVITYRLRVSVGNDDLGNVDSNMVIMMFAMLLALMSYDQISMIFSYLFSVIFVLTRSYFFFDEMFRYIRFNTYFAFSFFILFFFQRFYQQIERLNFEKTLTNSYTVFIFNNMIRHFHDGIVIVDKEEILYRNKKIGNIFDFTLSDESSKLRLSGEEIEKI